MEDKVTELEAKILSLERSRSKRRHKRERSSERSSPIDDRSRRRLRRKSLDSATASESMKLLMHLSSLESKVTNVAASNESLNLASDSETTTDNLEKNHSLACAKEKLNDCLIRITKFRSSRSKRSPSPGSERVSTLEQNLIDVCDILNHHICGINTPEAEVVICSTTNVVKQLQTLLLEKLTSLAEKRQRLRDNNKLDVKAKLELITEKIAYENILISRIQEALYSQATDQATCERLMSKETKETAHLMNSLISKLNGTAQKQVPVYITSAEYLAKVLATLLSDSGLELSLRTNFKRKLALPQQFFTDEQKKVNALYAAYKAVHLPQLAEILATEAYRLASDKACRLQYLSEDVIGDFNRAARESVNRELIESEINHVMLRAAQYYEANSNADNKFFFSFFASERAALELWADSVDDHLYKEVNSCIQEITDHYNNCLNKLQRQNWRRRLEWERTHKTADKLLNEFADIVAHKSLIDARLSVLNGETNYESLLKNDPVSIDQLLEKDSCKDFIEDHSSVQINQSLEAEFKYMLDRYSMECLIVVDRPEVEELLERFKELCCEVHKLKTTALNLDCPEDTVAVESLEDVCQKCACLIKELEEIREVIKRSR